jgi:hypothetical protein
MKLFEFNLRIFSVLSQVNDSDNKFNQTFLVVQIRVVWLMFYMWETEQADLWFIRILMKLKYGLLYSEETRINGQSEQGN